MSVVKFGHTLCIDPGSKESGFVVCRNLDNKIIDFGKIKNHLVFDLPICEHVLIEQFDFVVKGIGSEVVEAVFESGRFFQHFKSNGCPFVIQIGRSQVKKELGVKKDSDGIKLIKSLFPDIKLKKDAWQAFLLYITKNKNKICPKKQEQQRLQFSSTEQIMTDFSLE